MIAGVVRPDPEKRPDSQSSAEWSSGLDHRRRVAILGSTGSIGTQALKVIERNLDRFEVVALAARSRIDILALQAIQWRVAAVGIAGSEDDEVLASQLEDAIDRSEPGYKVEVLKGREALISIASRDDVDIVLNAIVGSAGLGATLATLRAGKRLALANKESLVAGGSLVREALSAGGGELVPVDSEHAGLAQCMRAGRREEIARLFLTASGGPFRGYRRADLEKVRVKDALAHPTWSMGKKISVDSATLMNKGLEAIEAHLLFDLEYDKIEVIVHPQSVVHALVEFIDGSTIAQMSKPTMEGPIGYALGAPHRLQDPVGVIDWGSPITLSFEPVDMETFRCLKIALAAGREGGIAPAIMNAANEVAVDAFLIGKIPFLAIPDAIEATLDMLDRRQVRSEVDLGIVEEEARQMARAYVERLGQN